jgi:hypothetical protein
VLTIIAMARIPRDAARELVIFAKSLKLSANYWDPKGKSAFEFARQMQSPKYKKQNPGFECTFVQTDKMDAPQLAVEFLDGSKWNVSTAGLNVNQLRAEFFTRAADVEDNLDVSPAEMAAAAGGKKPGDKGAKKK